jgi:hypothetical protein
MEAGIRTALRFRHPGVTVTGASYLFTVGGFSQDHKKDMKAMITWTNDELDKIGAAEELEIASLRRDGTLTKPVTIWVVRDDDDLYVRSVNGPTAAWFRGTQARHEGHIEAGGVVTDVKFINADPAINDELDAAYRAKYRRYAANIIDSIVHPKARSTTIKVVPRSTSV